MKRISRKIFTKKAYLFVAFSLFSSGHALASYAYVTNGSDGTVSVIDTLNYNLTATVTVGGFPWEIGITPNSAKVYVTN